MSVTLNFPAFNAARVYESDRRAAEVCRGMSEAGFYFDIPRAKLMCEWLRAEELTARDRVEAALGRSIKHTRSGGLSEKDLRAALFGDLRAPVYFRSAKTGAPSLSVDAMRGYAMSSRPGVRDFAVAELERRRLRKMRSTYVEGMIEDAQLSRASRIHPTWKSYGAVSGRFSCTDPGLQTLPTKRTDPMCRPSAPKEFKGGIRSLFCARPGWALLSYDKKQLEMRIAAYVSGDEAMIKACESSDLHAGNAAIIWPGEFDIAKWILLDGRPGEELTEEEAKIHRVLFSMRNLAKSSGFAVCYMAEAETVHSRIVADPNFAHVSLQAVSAMLRKLRTGFAKYFAFQAALLLEAVRTAEVRSPILGRRRWLGHDPSPTECANFPIQGGASDVMNPELCALDDALLGLEARIVAQVHDSITIETPEREVTTVRGIIDQVAGTPVAIETSGVRFDVTFPIDFKEAERWA